MSTIQYDGQCYYNDEVVNYCNVLIYIGGKGYQPMLSLFNGSGKHIDIVSQSEVEVFVPCDADCDLVGDQIIESYNEYEREMMDEVARLLNEVPDVEEFDLIPN